MVLGATDEAAYRQTSFFFNLTKFGSLIATLFIAERMLKTSSLLETLNLVWEARGFYLDYKFWVFRNWTQKEFSWNPQPTCWSNWVAVRYGNRPRLREFPLFAKKLERTIAVEGKWRNISRSSLTVLKLDLPIWHTNQRLTVPGSHPSHSPWWHSHRVASKGVFIEQIFIEREHSVKLITIRRVWSPIVCNLPEPLLCSKV